MSQQPITEQHWRSLHNDYLRFAILSLRDCDQSPNEPSHVYADRHVIDTIRYSYDCLDASIEFIYLLGRGKQLPISISDNWLSRSLNRKWSDLSLSDKFGMLAFAWTSEAFWQHDKQFQLFADLKKVRDALTHPIPFGTEIEFEIISDEVTVKDQVYRSGKLAGKGLRPTGKIKYLKRDLIYSKESVANFTDSADGLQKSDAEKAVEIMLRHVIRLEDLFFGRRTSFFAFYETSENHVYISEELLQIIKCRFDGDWNAN